MNGFRYFTPTDVRFGKGTEELTGELLKSYSANKVLIHYGSERVIKSGLIKKVTDQLVKEGIEYVLLGGVVANPRLSKVREGIELGKKEHVNFILSVGGGSVLDSAKAIAHGIRYDGDVWDFFSKKAVPEKTVPVGCILTLAATGSEMSHSAVITNEEGNIKLGLSTDLNRPAFAILNPELTISVNAFQTASGCTDIMMHTMERYFSKSAPLELTDSMAESLLKTVMKNALILKKDPENYEARAEIMWAGALSHNGLMGCGSDGGDWVCHKLEHEISGIYDVAHGAGLAAIWASWARHVYKEAPERFYKYAVNVMDVITMNDDINDEVIEEGIRRTEEFFAAIDMPVSISGLGIEVGEEEIKLMAEKYLKSAGGKALGSIKKITAEDAETIYRNAL